ncbi:hypothetical protein [Streptomyces sp. NPDC096311]
MNENASHKILAAATVHAWDAFVIVDGMLKGGTEDCNRAPSRSAATLA